VEEIAVLRNGKAKKTDAPIPADLAPISGKGKRVRKEKKLEDTAFLDPIKFRYREDAVVEEAPKKQENPEPKEQRSRNRRPNKGPQEQKRPQEQKPKEEGQPKPEHQPKQKQDAPKAEHQPKQKQDAPKADQENKADKPNQGKRPSGKRPNYHHRRKPKPQGGGQQNQG
jgi:outer membrane biosynthesis protein TonB